MSIKRKPRLYKITWNKKGNEGYNLIAATDEQDAQDRLENLLNVRRNFITEIVEITCGSSDQLILSTNIINNILQTGARKYINRLHGQDSYLNDENRENLQRAKYQLKG